MTLGVSASRDRPIPISLSLFLIGLGDKTLGGRVMYGTDEGGALRFAYSVRFVLIFRQRRANHNMIQLPACDSVFLLKGGFILLTHSSTAYAATRCAGSGRYLERSDRPRRALGTY